MAEQSLGLCTHLIGAQDYLPFARRCFNRLQESGASWIREDIFWHRIERQAGVFDYAYPEAFLSLAEEAGLKVLGILGFSNRIHEHGVLAEARAQGRYQEWLKRFVEYAERTIAHFRGRIDHWQIWNEPNISGFWPPKPDPAEYAEMVRVVYLLAKRANPACTLVVGATSGADAAYLTALYAHGLKGHFDAYSCHPYFHQHPAAIPGQHRSPNLTALASVREALDVMGDAHIPLWITEIGYPSVDYLGGEREQAFQLRQTLAAFRDLDRLGPVFWYDLKDDGPEATQAEHRFGLVREDLSLKPAFFEFQAQAQRNGAQVAACTATLGSRPLDPATVRIRYADGALIVRPEAAVVENYPLTAIEGLESLPLEAITRRLFDCLPGDLKTWRFRGGVT